MRRLSGVPLQVQSLEVPQGTNPRTPRSLRLNALFQLALQEIQFVLLRYKFQVVLNFLGTFDSQVGVVV